MPNTNKYSFEGWGYFYFSNIYLQYSIVIVEVQDIIIYFSILTIN